jgi:hypothetical protein
MAKKKDIRIGLYTLTGKNPNGSNVDFSELFAAVHPHMSIDRKVPKPTTRYRTLGSFDRAIYEVVKRDDGCWFGALGKYRDDANPIQINDDGALSAVHLSTYGALLERNFFMFVPTHSLLIYQEDRHGSAPKILAEYLDALFEQKQIECSVDPLLTKDATEKLRRGALLHRVEIKVADPTNPELYTDLMPDRALRALGGDEDTCVTIEFVARGRGHWLPAWVKSAVDRLFAGETVASFEKFEVELSQEDGTGTIEVDLLKERLKATAKIELVGNNLPPHRVYLELDRARETLWPLVVEVLRRDGLVR